MIKKETLIRNTSRYYMHIGEIFLISVLRLFVTL